MRLIIPAIVVATFASTFSAHAADPSIAAAQRKLEAAQLRLRLYENDEHPRALRRLERDIELTKAAVASHQRRVKEYEQFDKFSYSAPLFITLEQARLDLRQAELQLEELEEERWSLIRHHTDRCRLYQLAVEAATDALKSLH